MFGIDSILPWGVLSAGDRMLLVFQLSSALKKVHAQLLLHRDLKPENVMIDENNQVKLADFGGTKDQASINAGDNQTGVFSWGWADFQARQGKYSKESEVYSFACLAFYMLKGEALFTRKDEKAYLDNKTNINYASHNSYLLQGTLK